MRDRTIAKIFLFSMIIFTLLACSLTGSAEEAEEPDELTLRGQTWVLVSLNGKQPLADVRITAEFDGETMSGDAGCNGYSTSYPPNKSDIFKVIESALPDQVCESSIEQQHDAFIDFISMDFTHEIRNGKLILTAENGDTLTFEPLD